MGSSGHYRPRFLYGRLSIPPDNRTDEEKLFDACELWDQNELMWGDSLEAFGPRPASGPVARRPGIVSGCIPVVGWLAPESTGAKHGGGQ